MERKPKIIESHKLNPPISIELTGDEEKDTESCKKARIELERQRQERGLPRQDFDEDGEPIGEPEFDPDFDLSDPSDDLDEEPEFEEPEFDPDFDLPEPDPSEEEKAHARQKDLVDYAQKTEKFNPQFCRDIMLDMAGKEANSTVLAMTGIAMVADSVRQATEQITDALADVTTQLENITTQLTSGGGR